MITDEDVPQTNSDYVEDLTGEIAVERPHLAIAIGERLRDLREKKGIDLESLATITGLDIGFLAGIEGKEVQPQLGTLIKLSKALDSAFGRIVSGEGHKQYSVTRKGEQKAVHRSTGMKGKKHLYTYSSLASEVRERHMETFMVTLEENPEGALSLHDGEEFIYVIEGDVTAHVGEDQIALAPGDSIYYLSSVPHVVAAKKGTAKILAVIYDGSN
ncbi:MAG: XRE family transcriptional regulator [Pseudomonadota bacterium]